MTRQEMEAAIGGQLRAMVAASRRAKLGEAETQSYLSVILAYADAHAASERRHAEAEATADAAAMTLLAQAEVAAEQRQAERPHGS